MNLAFLLLLMAVTATTPLTKAYPMVMPPNPNSYSQINADGSRTPLIRLVGRHEAGENDAALEVTLDGFAVSRVNGNYMYLERDERSGTMISSGLIAGHDDPCITKSKKTGLYLKPNKYPVINQGAAKNSSMHQRRLIAQIEEANGIPEEHSYVARRRAPVLGNKVNLMVPFVFSDHTNRVIPSTEDLKILMNNQGPHTLCPSGSVRDVYLASSYNQMILDTSVAPWVTLPNTEAYYAYGNSGLTTMSHVMIRDALNALEDIGFDFSPYDTNQDGYIDAIGFFHSGYAAEVGGSDAFNTTYTSRIWSHKWSLDSLPDGQWISASGKKVYNYHIGPALWGNSGTSITRIGVVAHETGHFFGLPDLYDGIGGTGIGSYCLMSNAWGFDGSQNNPPLMSAWSKAQLGWITPEVVATSGTYTARPSCTYPDIFKISANFPPGEYLLVENRQRCKFDIKLPGPGLAIYHIDESSSFTNEGFPGQTGWPTNGNHYQVSLLQADGKYDLEKGQNRGDTTDLFSGVGVSGISSSGTSTGVEYPNTNAYQGGVIRRTGIAISNITSASGILSFAVNFDAVSPTMAPILPPENLFELSLQTDQYSSKDTYWDLFRITLSGLTLVASKSVGFYANNILYKEKYFLDVGTYQLDFKDAYGDGLRSPGFFKITLGGLLLKTGGLFNELDSTTFTVVRSTGKPSTKAPSLKLLAPAPAVTPIFRPASKPAITPTPTRPVNKPQGPASNPAVAPGPFPMPKASPVQPFRNIPRPSAPTKLQAAPVQKPASVCLPKGNRCTNASLCCSKGCKSKKCT